MNPRKLIFSSESLEVIWIVYCLYYVIFIERMHWQEPKVITILTMILMLWCIISDVLNIVSSFKTLNLNQKLKHILRIVFTTIILVSTFIGRILLIHYIFI